MTTTIRAYPTRVSIHFRRKRGQAALDQIRAIDKARLIKRLGQVSDNTANEVATVLVEMFRQPK